MTMPSAPKRAFPGNRIDEFEEQSFDRLMHTHFGLVYLTAKSVTRQDAMAKDVVQNTFIRLARQPSDSLPSGTGLLAWLRRTARFLAIDSIRAERTRRRYESTADEFLRYPAAAPPDLETIELLRAALLRLPEADRDLLKWRYFQNFTHRQIGGLLGVTEQAARKRSGKAIDKLRLLMAQQGREIHERMLPILLAPSASWPRPPKTAVTEPAARAPRLQSASVFPKWIMGMATLIVVGGGIVLAKTLAKDGSIGREDGSSVPAETALSSRGSFQSSRGNVGRSEAEFLALVQGWLLERTPRKWKCYHDPDRFYKEEAREALSRLGKNSLESLLAFDDAHPSENDMLDYPLREVLRCAIYREYGARFPAAALAYAYPDGSLRGEVGWDSILEGVAKVDPRRAYEALVSMDHAQPPVWSDDHDMFREMSLKDIFHEWAESRPGSLLEALPGIGKTDRLAAYSAYLTYGAEGLDWPEEVARFHELCGGAESKSYNQEVGTPLAAAWAVSDFESAVAWLNTLPTSPESKLSPGLAIVNYWVIHQPAFATNWLTQHRLPEADSDDFYTEVIRLWTDDEPALMSLVVNRFHDRERCRQVVESYLDDCQDCVLDTLSHSTALPQSTREKAAKKLAERFPQ